MIRLHYANRLEGLIPPLVASIAAQQRARPLQRVTIVVPSRVIEQFLKHRISEAIGIAANLDFPFLRRFFADVIHKADPKVSILEVEDLELALFESLRAAMRDDFHEFQPLRNYVDVSDATDAEREVRTFHLASQLARLFREYSISRNEMLQRWVTSTSSGDETSDSEKWQKRLWIVTFDANGYLRDELRADRESNWVLLPAAFEKLSDATLKAALPDIVHVFGLAYVGRAYLRLFSRIGRLTNLNLYALNPCLEFWEDVQHLSFEDRARWVRQHTKVEGDLDLSADPFNLDDDRDTPALRLWGRPGREYLRMLNELTDCDFEPHFAHRDQSADRMLLASVQEDILNRAPQRSSSDAPAVDNNGSMKFLACPGVAREAEIVANEIWAMLDRDEGDPQPIRFHQIGVLVPDGSYEEYLPHIENAFSRLHQLPMNIVSRASGSESPVREALDLLLRLPLGRFSRDELLHVLNHSAIKSPDAEFESDQTRRWCAEAGIFFGANAKDLANTYIPSDRYHWDQGIRRLALGVFMDTDRSEEARFYRAPDSIEYLPCETAQGESPAAAAFIASARRLLSDVTEIRSHKGTLVQWSRKLGEFLLAHTYVEDPIGERVRERFVEAIGSIASPELRAAPVFYPVVHEMVTARIAELESQAAQFTEHGVVIGPLSALRAIPFRAIFLVGLNEGVFPARDRRDPIDLRFPRRKAADVSPTERDRYLFLETLLAARERLCLSYVARDSKTGTRLEPSSVVRELQFILSGYMNKPAIDDLTLDHPLSRYDGKYFPDLAPEKPFCDRALASYDRDAKRGAAIGALRNNLARDCANLPLSGRDEPIYQQLSGDVQNELRPLLGIRTLPSAPVSTVGSSEISLPFSALRKFLECPLQGAAKYALRIFEDDDEDLEQQDEEPIAQSVLNRTNLLREVFWKARDDTALIGDRYAKAFRMSQLVGGAPAGPFAHAAERIDREKIELWMREAHAAGCGSLNRWQEVRMGRADEFAAADRVLGELSITVPAKLGDSDSQTRIVRINGGLGFLSSAGNSSMRLVLRDQSKPKDFLGAFLTAIVLAAAGELTEGRFHALVLGAGKRKAWNESRMLNCPGIACAQEYLAKLLSDLLFGKNHYFLPIEAIDEIYKELGRGREADLFDVVNEIREDEFARCSSDYGPIRDARRFAPPNIEEMKRIVDRRFSLIRAIFGREKN